MPCSCIFTFTIMASRPRSVLLPSEHVFNDPPPRRPSTAQKCSFCRRSRRAVSASMNLRRQRNKIWQCSYSDNVAAAKCNLCLEKGLPCSEPRLAPRKGKFLASPQAEPHTGVDVYAYRYELLGEFTAQSYAATEDFSAVP